MTAPDSPLFRTVLVANRGEIARRVIRTLRRLGIRSVAVYSDADAGAPHVREADEAVRIGPAEAAHSYLDVDALIRAAVATGAEAIHPGYGFLSENPALGRACAEAGIVFIGPGERALEVMADKIRARDHVAAHGVPIVPGFSAAGMDDVEIAARAVEAGFPLLIKPSAGGGGKGMRVVRAADELPDALATARRVATASFGDDTLLMERLIERPRHIEVQVLGDAHGTVIHLGERECTLQRRHQKVIEEAPSPLVGPELRERLGAAAVAAAASVDYLGAGTVEFLVSDERPDEFFFIEMNTRLQVEHPVTELVTGVDLVEQQLRIAAGRPLEIDQVEIVGHAIEARVYAESPARGFLPETGEVLAWRPAPRVRTDAAIETGSVITADYDPMIAKVISFAETRDDALDLLDEALAETVLLGVESNIAYLRDLLRAPEVRSGSIDTGLIDRRPAFVDPAPSARALAIAGHAVRRAEEDASSARGASPLWRMLPDWRMGGVAAPAPVLFEIGDEVVAAAPLTEPDRDAVIAVDGDDVWIHAEQTNAALRRLSRRAAAERARRRRGRTAGAQDPELRAPMPGGITALHVDEGSAVSAGDRILSVEAMKMEHPVLAPHDGVVHLLIAVGDQVKRDQIVARIDATRNTDTNARPGEEPQE